MLLYLQYSIIFVRHLISATKKKTPQRNQTNKLTNQQKKTPTHPKKKQDFKVFFSLLRTVFKKIKIKYDS